MEQYLNGTELKYNSISPLPANEVNLIHFYPKQMKSCWNRTIFKQNGKNLARMEQYLNGTKFNQIYILPMPAFLC
jgi:hypothetical protein